MRVITDGFTREYKLDNTKNTDISLKLQAIMDELYSEGVRNVTFEFLPGVYYFEHPLTVKFISVKLTGEAHGGVDIHGMNLLSGTVFSFGKNCAPNCITFAPCGDEFSFPSKKSPWRYKTTRVCIKHINFMGYNNTDVDTQKGYSRFEGDEPNFRGLQWYVQSGRYKNAEKEGQRAIVIEKSKDGEKPEMLLLENCYFTDLYVGLDITNCDVSNVHHCWFGQMVYGVRYHGAGQCIMMHDNCFADLETAIQLKDPVMSTLHNNTFAYLSKSIMLENANEVSINSNCVNNWEKATGTASCGAFLLARNCKNLNVNANTVRHALDSRVKTCTSDKEPNKMSFVHFKECENLMFTGNILDTKQTQTVVCLQNCKSVVTKNNLIKHSKGGNKIATFGECADIIADDICEYVGDM